MNTEQERAKKQKGRGHIRGASGQVCSSDLGRDRKGEGNHLACKGQQSREMAQQTLGPRGSARLSCPGSMKEASMTRVMRVAGEETRPGVNDRGLFGSLEPRSPSVLLPFRLEPCKGLTR